MSISSRLSHCLIAECSIPPSIFDMSWPAPCSSKFSLYEMLPHGSIYHFIPFLICLSAGVPASPLVGQIPPPSHKCIRMALGISYDCPSVVEFKKIDRNFNNLILRNCDGFEGVKFDTVRGLNLFCPEWKELPKNALAKNRCVKFFPYTFPSCLKFLTYKIKGIFV